MIVKRRLPIANQSATEDMLFGVVTAMASEIAVLRERLDTLERLLNGAGIVKSGDVDSFVADDAAIAERDRLRQGLISRVFRPIEDAAKGDTA